MLFNSFGFIFVFLPVAVLGFHLLRELGQHRAASDWLIACSLFFYAWGNPNDLPILLASVLFNYGVARWMGAGAGPQDTRRKSILAFGIAANLALLVYFKARGPLPLGISFWTLVQVMYLVDCYEGMVKPSNLREHALFATFFPVVSMGPMLRAKDTLAQLRGPSALGFEQLAPAILLFCLGLFKKVVIADSFARLADAGYASPAALSLAEGWIASLSYCLQLYYDFSGYSDMAMAAALALGIRIPANFNDPYRARSIVDFWRRWHITLSSFITTYLYTPMVRAMGKVTFAKAMIATFAAMVIAGLWHGSSWGFLVFGALHGLGLVEPVPQEGEAPQASRRPRLGAHPRLLERHLHLLPRAEPGRRGRGPALARGPALHRRRADHRPVHGRVPEGNRTPGAGRHRPGVLEEDLAAGRGRVQALAAKPWLGGERDAGVALLSQLEHGQTVPLL